MVGRISWPIIQNEQDVNIRKTRLRTDTKVLGIRLEQRVLLGFGGLASTEGGSSGLLARSNFGFGGLVIETISNETTSSHCASEL